MAGLFAIPAWPSPAARQQTQYPSISDKPIRFDSLRVMKKGRWEPFGITPSQEPLSLLAEGQLQRSLNPLEWLITTPLALARYRNTVLWLAEGQPQPMVSR